MENEAILSPFTEYHHEMVIGWGDSHHFEVMGQMSKLRLEEPKKKRLYRPKNSSTNTSTNLVFFYCELLVWRGEEFGKKKWSHFTVVSNIVVQPLSPFQKQERGSAERGSGLLRFPLELSWISYLDSAETILPLHALTYLNK